jgi:hypothetical protein
MKSLYKVLLVATMLLNTSIASAAYVVTNSNNSGDFTPGFVTGSIPSFTLVGSDKANDEGAPNIVTYTDTFLSDTILSFDWEYELFDTYASDYEKAGYVINNTFTQLSKDGREPPTIQSGSVLISIMANDIFGWYIDSYDSLDGNAVLKVTNYSATPSAVPVPAALPLMASALVAFGISRRSKAKA